MFDVEDYESYVQVQSESAIRSIASLYAYDHGEEHELTLRGGGDEVAHELKKELEVRLGEGRRRRRGGAAHAPRLCARDRAGDAAPPAGRSRHRGAREDRARRRQHGRDGARRARQRRTSSSSTRSARPRWSAICSSCSAAPRKLRPSSTPARSTAELVAEERKSFLLRLPPELWKELEKWAADELRSVNGQIEYLLRQAVREAPRPSSRKARSKLASCTSSAVIAINIER